MDYKQVAEWAGMENVKNKLFGGRGRLHIYTGDGKGKTTAAFGLAMRCCGCGGRVVIVQFLKTAPTGEVEFIEKLQNPNLKVYRFETPHGFFNQLDDEQKKQLKSQIDKAVCFIEQRFLSADIDLLVLDEILLALKYSLIDESRLLKLLGRRPKGMEVVLTGRGAPRSLIDIADYVTCMDLVKHPYTQGVDARKGIEY